MLYHSLLITFRSLWKNKGYALINLTGLAVGMGCSFLIILWVWDELRYDAFHENASAIYQIGRNRPDDSGLIGTRMNTPFPLAGSLQRDFPEIKYACRVNLPDANLLTVGEKNIYQRPVFADSVFLEMFSFPVLQGSAQKALDEERSIVLTANTAKILFGNESALGKTVRFNNALDLNVTAIVANVPANSTFQFDVILPYKANLLLSDWYKTLDNDWGNYMVQTFVQLKNPASETQLNPKIKRFLSTKTKDSYYQTLFLHPMTQWRLYDKFENGQATGGLIEYVRLFSWIAGFILLIACINFMNLATARSEKRAKEVGIRKVVGSSRTSLIVQFLGESNVLALLALGMAVLLVNLLLPWFNQITNKQIAFPINHPLAWLIALGTAVLAGMLAGVYPAFYLSSFQPVRVLKGTFLSGKRASLPRKVLVSLQFAFSILLIISVIVINKQVQYSKNRSVGYEQNNLVMADFNDELKTNYEALRQELISSGFVSSVCGTQAPITEIRMSNSVKWRPQQQGGVITLSSDYDYLPTFGIKITQGRGFSRNFQSDSSAVLINETALKMMNFKEPIGEKIVFGEKTYHVIGVIEDVIMGSPYEATEPAGVFFKHSTLNKVNIRFISGVPMQKALSSTARIFEKHSPSYPFNYQFVDEEYNQKFASEVRVGYLANAFAGLAIFISCLGLFGLAAYTAERRTKEIGIRKVLGATLTDIITLLSKEYVALVSISMLIAAPLAWYFLENWLQSYPYRIQISWWIFALAGLSALLIALLTVSFQALKAALANPVKSLRTE
jgi:ABC-type antimicrobial peptide transport system permease subunit